MTKTSFSLFEHGGKVTDAFGLVGCYRIALPEVQQPTVTIVIPIHNQLEYTLKCLQSLSQHSQSTTFEVLIVEDSSDPSVFRALIAIPNLRVARNFKNQGFVRGCNRGAKLARGQFIVLLNNDTEVTEGWLDALMRVFQSRPDAGLVGSKLIYPDGTLQEAGGIVWQDGTAWNYGRNDDPTRPWYNYVRETDYCSAAAVMLPKSLWTALGGFDLRYAPAYCEDSDLAFRVREAGYKVYVQPKSVVVHYEGKSNGTDTGAGIKQYQVLNHQKLVERWSSVFAKHRPNAVDVFKARDRTIGRPVILVIDHYLPHYDQDAGSRTIWAFLKLFLKEGFAVKFIGDNFCSHEPYKTVMEELGIEVLTGQWMEQHWEEWMNENGKYIDYVLLSRTHTSQRFLDPVSKLPNAKILFYGHDLISRTSRLQYQFSGSEEKLSESRLYTELEARVFSIVDVVYYPSPLEIEEISKNYPKLNARVITPYVYENIDSRPVCPTDFESRNGILFVGGFRHPPNVEAVLWFCKNAMPKLIAALPGIHFTIAGSHPTAEILANASENVTVTGYISDTKLEELYRKSRIVVVPLLTGGGIKGKVVEALSFGTPVVTTPVGSEGIADSDSAMRIAEPNKLTDAIIEVYQDLERLSGMVNRGKEIITNHYSLIALKQVFEQDVTFYNHAL